MTNCAVDIRGRSVKIVGLKIIIVPKDKSCIINGFHIKNGKIVKRGEIKFVPSQGDLLFQITNNIIK
jgi:hypothetical protein